MELQSSAQSKLNQNSSTSLRFSATTSHSSSNFELLMAMPIATTRLDSNDSTRWSGTAEDFTDNHDAAATSAEQSSSSTSDKGRSKESEEVTDSEQSNGSDCCLPLPNPVAVIEPLVEKQITPEAQDEIVATDLPTDPIVKQTQLAVADLAEASQNTLPSVQREATDTLPTQAIYEQPKTDLEKTTKSTLRSDTPNKNKADRSDSLTDQGSTERLANEGDIQLPEDSDATSPEKSLANVSGIAVSSVDDSGEGQDDGIGRARRPTERSARWYERDLSKESDASTILSPSEALESSVISTEIPAGMSDHFHSDPIQVTAAASEFTNVGPSAEALAIEVDTLAISTSGPYPNPPTVSVQASIDSGNGSSHNDHAAATAIGAPKGAATFENDGTIVHGAGTQSRDNSVELSNVEKAKLIQRVARSFSRLGSNGGSIQLRLHPPELGALAMQVRIEGKSLTAKLTTENSTARDIIMESLPQLRSRLAEQGFDVAQFTVEVASDGAALGGQSQSDQNQQQSPSSNYNQPASDLRRANFLRRNLDRPERSRPLAAFVNGRGLDVQA